MTMKYKRFEEIYSQGKLTVTKILRDNETGILYMVDQEGYGIGADCNGRQGKKIFCR